MLRGRVPYKGKFVKADNIPVGEPILLSVAEWRARDRDEARKSLLFLWVVLPVITVPMMMLFHWATDDIQWPDIIYFAIIYGFPLPAMLSITELVNSRRAFRRGVYTGLFENGLRMRLISTTRADFIPYALIVDFRVIEKWKGKHMEVDIVGFEEPFLVLRDPLLEDDSLGMLRRIITEQGKGEPPELHVYGGRASKLRAIPRYSKEGPGSEKD